MEVDAFDVADALNKAGMVQLNFEDVKNLDRAVRTNPRVVDVNITDIHAKKD